MTVPQTLLVFLDLDNLEECWSIIFRLFFKLGCLMISCDLRLSLTGRIPWRSWALLSALQRGYMKRICPVDVNLDHLAEVVPSRLSNLKLLVFPFKVKNKNKNKEKSKLIDSRNMI